MNTAVTIVDDITGTVVKLAFIGAALKLLLVVAPRFSIGNPRAPQQPRNDPEAKANTPKAAEPAAELKAVGA